MTAHTEIAAADEGLSKSRLRLWLKLLKASKLIGDEIRRNLRKEFQSTLPRFDVMSALERAPDGLLMSEISRMLRVSNGNITGIVDRLTEEGLVERVGVPRDRRAHLVRLTTTGRHVFAGHAKAHEGWIDDLLDGLDAKDIEETVRCLDHLTTQLGERA